MTTKNAAGLLLALLLVAATSTPEAKDKSKYSNPLAGSGKPVAEQDQQQPAQQQPQNKSAPAAAQQGKAKPKLKTRRGKTCRDRQGNKTEC
jgi:hypothetical protein